MDIYKLYIYGTEFHALILFTDLLYTWYITMSFK